MEEIHSQDVKRLLFDKTDIIEDKRITLNGLNIKRSSHNRFVFSVFSAKAIEGLYITPVAKKIHPFASV